MLVQTCFNRRSVCQFEWPSVCHSGLFFNKSVLLCTHPLSPFFLPLSPSAFLQRTSSSFSSSPRLLYRHIYSHFNENDIWAAILICSHLVEILSFHLAPPSIPKPHFSPSLPFLLSTLFLTFTICHRLSCALNVISLHCCNYNEHHWFFPLQ